MRNHKPRGWIWRAPIAFAVLMLTTAAPAATDCPFSFHEPSTIPTGVGSVSAISTADFNHDGFSDLIVASGNQLSIIPGVTGGAFGPPRVLTLPFSPTAMFVADFNGDAQDDIVAADGDHNQVAALMGKADGSFGDLVYSAVGSGPLHLEAGDYNGDGKLDLAVVAASGDSWTLRILLGKGDGSFAAHDSIAIGERADLRSADVNHDGHPDIVVLEPDQVLVFLSALTGFSPPLATYVGGHGPGIALADFNRDGLLDIALDLAEDGMNILDGDGEGHFRYRVNLAADLQSSGLITADVNGDQVPDVIFAVPSKMYLQVFMGDGRGSFLESADYLSGYEETKFVFIREAGLSEVVSGGDTEGTLTVVALSDVLGSLPPDALAGAMPTTFGATDLAVADFNNDGILDISANGPSFWSILLGQGGGRYQPSIVVPLRGALPAGQAMTADFDHDGNIDVGFSLDYGFAVFLGGGDGSFNSPVITSFERPTAVLPPVELDNDGFPDLVTMTITPPAINIYRGRGDGTFQFFGTTPLAGEPTVITLGDFDGDGRSDICFFDSGRATRTSFPLSVLFGNGDGTFTPGADVSLVGTPVSVAAGDLNGDGIDSLVMQLASFSAERRIGLEVVLGGRDRILKPGARYPDRYEAITQIVDFDGDGAADLFVPLPSGFEVFQGNGDGTFRPRARFASNNRLGLGFALADLNGDGWIDVVAGNDDIDGPVGIFIQESGLEVNPRVLPDAHMGRSYEEFLACAGASGGCSYSIQSGTLPPGVDFDNHQGTLLGTPTVAGRFHFVVLVRDSNGCTGRRSYYLSVENPPARPRLSPIAPSRPAPIRGVRP